MIAALLGRVGLSAVTRGGWVFMAVIVAVASAGAAWGAWTVCDWRWQAAKSEALEQEIAARLEAEKRANDLAAKYLVAKDQRRIVYRERIRNVPTYIDRDNCRVTDDGLRDLACALDPAACPAKPDPTPATAANAKGAGS